MSPRYLLVAGGGPGEQPDGLDLLERQTGLTRKILTPRLAVLANAACPILKVDEDALALGWLFHRHGSANRIETIDPGEAQAIRTSDGQRLLRAYWGGYVAAIAGPGAIRMLRDPSAALPCYRARYAGLDLFASDADILTLAGARVRIDVEEVGAELYRAFVPKARTALAGIEEVRAGFALCLDPEGCAEEPVWSPWDYAARADAPREINADTLARTIQHCVGSWASHQDRILLSVSGGLDSSIVAACLARAKADTVCLTMFAEDPAGDERTFARALCDHLGLPLVERQYRLEDIDIDEPLAPHLPQPRDRTQAIAYERVHLDVANEIGATAFMTGNGGDHVFGFSQSAAPAADRYLAEGLGSGAVQSLLDVSRHTGCSLFEAFAHAWRLARRPATATARPNALLLAKDFVASLDPNELHHPWLEAPPGALPGKAAHVAGILRVQPILEGHRGAFRPMFSPLLSQPIVESCLAAPSWAWRAGGRDRALVREAFADALPPTVRDRRIKGSPSGFAARLLDHFRGPIRERLLGGRLAAHGILDAKAVETVLAGDGPVPDLERVRLLEMVNAEAWMSHWAERLGSAAEGSALRGAGGDRFPASADPIP